MQSMTNTYEMNILMCWSRLKNITLCVDHCLYYVYNVNVAQ